MGNCHKAAEWFLKAAEQGDKEGTAWHVLSAQSNTLLEHRTVGEASFCWPMAEVVELE